MIRTVSGPSPKAALFSAILVLAAFAPAQARAGKPSTVSVVATGAGTSADASENRRDEDSRLLVTGDFNRDGIADIAEATLPAGGHSGPSVLTVSLGRADGTFKQMASKQILGRGPTSMVLGDFNRDGIQDLIIGDEDGALMLFLGDGTGNLIPAGEIAHLDSVVSIAVADFNHDGIPDIAVSDWRASSVAIFLGAGNGSFRREWSFALRMPGTDPKIATGDFNRDGIPDLAVVYGGEDGDYTYDVMLGDGKGSFTNAPKLSFVHDPGCPTL
jgi:hypothetical protein